MLLRNYIVTKWYSTSCDTIRKLLQSTNLHGITLQEIDFDSLSLTERTSLKLVGVPVLILLTDEGVELKRMKGVPTMQQLEEFLSA